MRQHHHLRAGEETVIPGFGIFHVGVKSDSVEDPADFDTQRHIHDLHIKFRPASRHGPITWKHSTPMLENTEVVMV